MANTDDIDIIEAIITLAEATTGDLEDVTLYTRGMTNNVEDYPVIMVGVGYVVKFEGKQLGAIDKIYDPFVIWIEDDVYDGALARVSKYRDALIAAVHNTNLGGTVSKCYVKPDAGMRVEPVMREDTFLYRAELHLWIEKGGAL